MRIVADKVKGLILSEEDEDEEEGLKVRGFRKNV